MLTKQETLLEEGTGGRAAGSGNPGELPCRLARSLGFYFDGISFRVVLANHSCSESFLVAHTLLSQDGC